MQVIRFNHVVDMPVKVIGDAGFERTQVSGVFLPTDAAIVESSLPMASGTVIRFNGEPAGLGPAPGRIPGRSSNSPRPSAAPVRVGGGGNRVAPIGSPDAVGTTKGRPGTGKAATKGTTRPAGHPDAAVLMRMKFVSRRDAEGAQRTQSQRGEGVRDQVSGRIRLIADP